MSRSIKFFNVFQSISSVFKNGQLGFLKGLGNQIDFKHFLRKWTDLGQNKENELIFYELLCFHIEINAFFEVNETTIWLHNVHVANFCRP